MRHLTFIKTRIGRRFLAVLLIVCVFSPAMIGWLGIEKSESVIRQQDMTILRTASDGAEAQLREFLADFDSLLFHVSQREDLLEALRRNALTHGADSNLISSISNILRSQQHR